MTDILSEKLNLRVNNYPIMFNQKLNKAELENNNFNKMGLLAGLMLRSNKREIIFWSKNSILKYFEEDDTNSIRPALNKDTNPRQLFGTTAYLHFDYNNLSRFAFQITNNSIRAVMILDDLVEKIEDCIGQAPTVNHVSKTWEAGNQKLVLEYPSARQHGYIHLFMDDE